MSQIIPKISRNELKLKYAFLGRIIFSNFCNKKCVVTKILPLKKKVCNEKYLVSKNENKSKMIDFVNYYFTCSAELSLPMFQHKIYQNLKSRTNFRYENIVKFIVNSFSAAIPKIFFY